MVLKVKSLKGDSIYLALLERCLPLRTQPPCCEEVPLNTSVEENWASQAVAINPRDPDKHE